MASDALRPGAPVLTLGRGRAGFIGPPLALAPHRNAAVTVAFALAEPFRLSLQAGPEGSDLGPGSMRHAAVIPAGQLHHLQAAGPMALLYLDALSDDPASLSAAGLDRAWGELRAGRGATRGGGLDLERVGAALGLASRALTDPAAAAWIRLIDERPQDFPSVTTLAAAVGLSPSRVQARLSASLGLPFRRYRLWRRMARVMVALSGGQSLTDAAMDAGFASPSHLSTTFKAMFGIAPSRLVALGVRVDSGHGVPAGDAPAGPVPAVSTT